MGAFHYAKSFRNFGWEINGIWNGIFRSKWPMSSRGGPLWPTSPVWPKITAPFPKNFIFSPTSLRCNQDIGWHVNEMLWSSCKLCLIQTMLFHFLLVPLIYDQSVWHHGKYTITIINLQSFTKEFCFFHKLSAAFFHHRILCMPLKTYTESCGRKSCTKLAISNLYNNNCCTDVPPKLVQIK